MKKILIADFSKGNEKAYVRGLYQHDYGAILKVTGIEYAEIIRVDFAGTNDEKAHPVVALQEPDGGFCVKIPKENTDKAGELSAYIYVTDAEAGFTIKEVILPIIKRIEADPDPSGEKTDPFAEAIEEIKKNAKAAGDSAASAAESEKTASESATQAKKSAVKSQKSAEAAAASEQAAATSATAAAQSASQSRESATTAQTAADQAAKSATVAAESATTATQQATNAAQSATNASGSAESASQSAETAKTAADAAGKSASAAQQASRSAAESASTATAAAQTAITAAGEASESATTAVQSAETAGQKATAAETAASNAEESATAAEKSATAAGDSTSAAKASETAAGEAAQTAQEQAEKIKASAEQIEKNKTDVTSLKEDISNKITKFYASNQGETHITDSDNGKIRDMVLYGKSEQNQYKGINLLPTDISYLEIIEVSIPKGTRIFWATDGTPALGGNFRFYNEDKTQETWFGVDAGKTAMTSTMNIDAKYIEFLIPEDQSVKICLGIGDDPAYEPYTGGQPSPSPDYPQEIKSVVNPTIKVCGKNLFDKNTFISFDSAYINNNIITRAYYNRGIIIKLNKGTYYYAQCSVKTDVQIGIFKEYPKIGSIAENFIYARPSKPVKKEIVLNDTRYLFIKYTITNPENNVSPQAVLESILLMHKTDDEEYEPYTGQSIQLPITLNAIPVTSGGNVTIDGQRYISDYVDVERGKVVRNMESFFFNGSEDWVESEKRTFFFIQYVSAGNNYDITHCFSDIGEAINYQILDDKSGFGISYMYTWRVNLQQCNIIDGKTSDDLKLYLSNHPINAIIKLKTPIEEDLSVEQAQALKELSTLYPVTDITVGSEQLDGYTVFNYPISIENGWNYVKKQLNDNRDYIYDMDLQSAEAYVNSEYAVTLTELEVM